MEENSNVYKRKRKTNGKLRSYREKIEPIATTGIERMNDMWVVWRSAI